VQRPRTAPAVALIAILGIAVLGIAACGDDDGDDQALQDDFPALSERIEALGEDVGDTIETAENASNEELAREFDDYAQELGGLRRQLEDLEPSEELADEREDLVSAMGEVRSSLQDIAQAAEEGDPEAARDATIQLLDRSQELRDARQALASAVRQEE
jgi:predicted  nucleic acid-binding Zn-ribbon protein